VETLSIVAEFDVPGNICSGVFAGGVDGAVDSLDFHGGVEGFSEGASARCATARALSVPPPASVEVPLAVSSLRFSGGVLGGVGQSAVDGGSGDAI
jgi:hypothetical protein